MSSSPATLSVSPHTALNSALRTLKIEGEALHQLENALTADLGHAFCAAVDKILAHSGRVILTGMGKSGHVGRKIAATLASTGTPAHFVHPAEASHGDLGMITSDDVIVALSWSGETAELRPILAYAARFDISVIALTSKHDSALANAADVALTLPVVTEACPHGLAPTSSTLMQLALGDALAIALLEAKGFSAQDFRTFHPGGKLGAQLKHVEDIMHKGDSLPVIGLHSTMAEALVVMSAKGFGMAIVVDDKEHLAGVITDGDLRRHMSANLIGLPVGEVMTAHPRTIARDMLAVEALRLINETRITTLLVVEHKKPVGLVHVHDLLRLGVA